MLGTLTCKLSTVCFQTVLLLLLKCKDLSTMRLFIFWFSEQKFGFKIMFIRFRVTCFTSSF